MIYLYDRRNARCKWNLIVLRLEASPMELQEYATLRRKEVIAWGGERWAGYQVGYVDRPHHYDIREVDRLPHNAPVRVIQPEEE
jgi:hypothetical protein